MSPKRRATGKSPVKKAKHASNCECPDCVLPIVRDLLNAAQAVLFRHSVRTSATDPTGEPGTGTGPCGCNPFWGMATGIPYVKADGTPGLLPFPPGNTGSYTLKWVNGAPVWVNDN